jgi:hypothetical protein
MVETGSDRAPRDAEHLGDHGWLVSQVMTKHEDCALFRLQSAERAIHDVSIDDTRELVPCGVIGKLEDLEPGVTATVSPRVLDAHVREHALDPEIEPVRIAEVRQVTPGDHQRVLQGILGPVDIMKDPAGDPEQAIEASTHQVHESDLVATLRRDHEFSIHRRRSS